MKYEERIKISSGAAWEDVHGYSRAVKAGDMIFISGTTAVDDEGKTVGEDFYEQTKYILQKLAFVLRELDASLEDVVRTRIYTVDIEKWEEIAKAHGEFFGEVKPASTMVEVKRLIREDLSVEIEIDAVIRKNRL
ncbi:MAG: RidA family protein [Chlorobi bacterium]|nr:RidA family protein [Chlorobiota bacterium]